MGARQSALAPPLDAKAADLDGATLLRDAAAPANEKALHFEGDSLRQNIFALWPGFEEQLELSFAAVDVNNEGLARYRDLEPLLRHHIMQLGYLEMLVPFVDKQTGEVLLSEVAHYLARSGVDVTREFDLEDWKNFAVAWVQRLLDAQMEAAQRWKDTEVQLAAEQTRKYREAMQNYQTEYVDQLKAYYDAVESAFREQERERKEWQETFEQQSAQMAFYEAQMDFVNQGNEEAARALAGNPFDKEPDSASVMRNVMAHLGLGSHTTEDGSSVLKFAYPANGPPLSAGAPVPRRRTRGASAKRQQCQSVGCF